MLASGGASAIALDGSWPRQMLANRGRIRMEAPDTTPPRSLAQVPAPPCPPSHGATSVPPVPRMSALAGLKCRCGTHASILRAIKRAQTSMV